MKIIKHFIKITKFYFNRITCKHKNGTTQASCPFTNKTYTYCIKCGYRMSAVETQKDV